MHSVVVPLDGVPTPVERARIPLDKILLDIANPRIQYYLDARLDNEVTQDEVKLALAESNEQYDNLKGHIERNGGIYNPIWVVLIDEFYKVVEGNTRALVYSELAEKYVNDPKWKAIDAYVLPREISRDRINFIRLEAHLFGPTPWDAYEKARELYRLHTEEDYSLQRLEHLTKLSTYDITISIKAFRDMSEQYLPQHDRPGEHLKFSYFAEFHKNKDLKRLVREGKLTLSQFCDLVGEGKFGRGEHVRKLAMVWSDDDARSVLLNEDMESALDQLAQRNPSARSKLFERIDDVIYGLEHMQWQEADEIKRGLQSAKVVALLKLHHTLEHFLESAGIVDNGE